MSQAGLRARQYFLLFLTCRREQNEYTYPFPVSWQAQEMELG